jgi:hypothetical protein
VSGRRGKARRRSGHPARVSARERQQAPAATKVRLSQPRPRPSTAPKPRRPSRGWDLGAGARLRQAWISLLQAMLLGSRARNSPRAVALRGRPAADEPAPRALGERPAAASAPGAAGLGALHRVDLVWAAATAALSVVLFATVLDSFPWLGDAPETVAGVSSLGILHDPGYPSYVLAAHLFTLIVPAGSEAFAVNLFSLVCASVSIGALQLLARRLGAPRWAASLGALTLAASAGYWYYSGFAKHDIFSGLVYLLSLHLLLDWRARPSTGRLVTLALVVAVGLGSSWPLEVLILPSIVFVLIAARAQLLLRSLAAALASGLAALAAIYGFVMFRAGQHPAVDWGGATTLSRLVALVRRGDFSPHGSTAPKTVAAASAHAGHGVALFANIAGDVGIFARELGVLALLLAVLGFLASVAWRRAPGSWPVLIALVVNLIGAYAVVDFGSQHGGFNSDLTDEGFVLGAYFVTAGWVALGAGELVSFLAGRRGTGRIAPRLGRRLLPVAAAALAAAVLVPAVLGNWSVVHRSSRDFTDGYAGAVLDELPPHAAVFVLGAELTQPLIYRQVVYRQRPDVAVIAADGLEFGWYRQQLSQRLHISLPPATGDEVFDGAQVIQAVARTRPVYLDPQAAEQFGGQLGYRPVGLLARLEPGRGLQHGASPAAVYARLLTAERLAGFPNRKWTLWPNDYVDQAEFAAAALKVAQLYYEQRDFAGMRSALVNTLRVEPGDQAAQRDLSALARSGALGG